MLEKLYRNSEERERERESNASSNYSDDTNSNDIETDKLSFQLCGILQGSRCFSLNIPAFFFFFLPSGYCLSRSVPETHLHVARTLSNQQTSLNVQVTCINLASCMSLVKTSLSHQSRCYGSVSDL